MAVLLNPGISLWDTVLEFTKTAQLKKTDPLIWAIHLSCNLNSAGVSIPSPELAHLLVSHICWENNVSTAWKLLDKALATKIVHPHLVLALLSNRVVPYRQFKPAAYRLFLELVKRYCLVLKPHIEGLNNEKVMNSIDSILCLSNVFCLEVNEPGILLVGFIFSIVCQLVDASLDDEGLLELVPEKKSHWIIQPTEEMEVDVKTVEHHEKLQKSNTTMAIELIGQFLQSKVTSRILFLACQNMSKHWSSFKQRMELLAENSAALRNSKTMTPKALLKLISGASESLSREGKAKSLQDFHHVMSSGRLISSAYSFCNGVSRSVLWLPIDLLLEDAMDGSQVDTTNAVEVTNGLIKALQAINGTTWHETLLGLWMAALRLVQREKDPIEGPIPRLDTRMSMLLTITTLVVADLIEEEEGEIGSNDEMEINGSINCIEKQGSGNRRRGLISSLQSLADYQSLLTPPPYVVSAANQAAAKAMMFVSGVNFGSAYFDMTEMPTNCSGTMHHLIVEACIARNLLDTSAYFWPGYVNGCISQLPHNLPIQASAWSSFMKGAPLTPIMTNALVSAPASSLAELEKVFEVASKGSDDEKIAAATILCGASLIHGWNIQEHTVYLITRLLSPPISDDHSGHGSHLINLAPMLNALIVGIAPVDCVQIFSLHGLIPLLAGSLMPICEVLGSCVPNVSWTLPAGEELSAYVVFSNAFALLLKLWRFNHPPLEYGIGDVPPVGSQLTPEYLLLVRNSYLALPQSTPSNQNRRRLSAVASSLSPKPVFLDSFPKLKRWYRQHQACIASTLSGPVYGTPVHQIVDGLLNMMFKKINRAGSQSVTTVTSGSSGSSGAGSDDSSLRPKLPAWDILEVVPFVVDAALAACAHGKLSPREFCTGLKDLADFLLASFITIVSYFSAEVTCGAWKPVVMNGTDWPSPAANLSTVEEQIKRILAATGVDVPSLVTGEISQATLPLPLAAFLSLTITYKLDKASQRFLNLAGPALESLAAGCPWPCMPIVASLWAQKARRWSDFLVFSASRTVFLHNNDAAMQLLKSCFTVTLGLNSTPISNNGGVGALLGHGFGSHFHGGISPVAPGILYLRVYRSIRDIMFLREEIISLLMQSVSDIACSDLHKEKLDRMKKAKHGLRNGHVSLQTALAAVKVAASLGASLIWFSGGLGLVQSLMKETLPSWFISVQRLEQDESSGAVVLMLKGYALAYFAVVCGAFAWGADSSSTSASKRRSKILGQHMEFLASVLDGKISLGCHWTIWRAYISGFLSLMVHCMPGWVSELNVDVLKRLSKGLRLWDEDELALALLGRGGVGTMSAAAEIIVDNEI